MRILQMKNIAKYENGKEYKMKIGNSEVTFILENFSDKVVERFNQALADAVIKDMEKGVKSA
jgi:hypothetical protein